MRYILWFIVLFMITGFDKDGSLSFEGWLVVILFVVPPVLIGTFQLCRTILESISDYKSNREARKRFRLEEEDLRKRVIEHKKEMAKRLAEKKK